MDNQDNLINNDNQDDEREEVIASVKGDTYPISDNESTTDSVSLIDTNIIKDENQGELNGK